MTKSTTALLIFVVALVIVHSECSPERFKRRLSMMGKRHEHHHTDQDEMHKRRAGLLGKRFEGGEFSQRILDKRHHIHESQEDESHEHQASHELGGYDIGEGYRHGAERGDEYDDAITSPDEQLSKLLNEAEPQATRPKRRLHMMGKRRLHMMGKRRMGMIGRKRGYDEQPYGENDIANVVHQFYNY